MTFPQTAATLVAAEKSFVDPAPAENVSDVASERLLTSSRLFAYTQWDAVPVVAAIFHCLYFFALFWLFSRVPLWVMLPLGFIYSVSISWNINGISHNFIHNPYFRSSLLNRLFSVMESITVGFSQVFYECIHMQHHKGNADRPDDRGHTIDWISIYKHGEPSLWEYKVRLSKEWVAPPRPLAFVSSAGIRWRRFCLDRRDRPSCCLRLRARNSSARMTQKPFQTQTDRLPTISSATQMPPKGDTTCAEELVDRMQRVRGGTGFESNPSREFPRFCVERCKP